jgi:hypothetical protein
MGQTRKDTGPQLAAKRRAAERDRCPKCGRGKALVREYDSWDDENGRRAVVTFVNCRWRIQNKCDYQATIGNGNPA